jgi:hypothetical protein
VPTALVEIDDGADAKFVAVNVNGPPVEPAVIFCSVKVGNFGVFVKVQIIFAKGFKLIVGRVTTLPARDPKLAGFPDVAALLSKQVAVDKLKLLLAVSVNVTGVLMLVTEIKFTDPTGGVGVLGAGVVSAAGVPARFVVVKLNGPPAKTSVVFWIATTGIAGLTMLVNTQVI